MTAPNPTPLPSSGWALGASTASAAAAGSWTRPMLRDLAEGVWSVVVAGVGLLVGLWVVGDIGVTNVPGLVGAFALAVILFDVLGGPLLRRLASRGSVALALLLGVAAQLALVGVVLFIAVEGAPLAWSRLLLVLVIAAAFLSGGRWLLGAADSGYVVGSAISHTNRWRASRRRGAVATGEPSAPRGLLIVQLDGVSGTVLRRAIAGGQAPNLAQWLHTTHALDRWWATIPSTTPASMAGFLHRDSIHVPAFRWWDRATGRLLAVSRPADSAVIEQRFASGDGLLRDGGSAISTTFTGEADHCYLTISEAVRRRGLGDGATFVSFFARPFLLPGALVLTIGEMFKELYQARRQKVRGVQPRISRRGTYVALRGITNVLLRKLNLSLVAQEMNAGRPVIFVDFVDYDEIAHHAGPERPEAMRALEGMDAVLGTLRDVAGQCTTEYDIVILSDHGQSLGSTFEQLTGRSFADHVSDLMDEPTSDRVEHSDGEEWAPVNALIASVLGRFARSPESIVVGPDREGTHQNEDDIPELAVTGGGNLGMIWFPRLPKRPSLGEIVDRWPRLVAGLVATDGVGLVMVAGEDATSVVFGRDGAIDLEHGIIEGTDPLVGFPPRTAADLARLHATPDAGDVVVISSVDEYGHIHAFEHQVGSHGGIGGPQNDAILIHPAQWPVDPAHLIPVGDEACLVGPVSVHDQLLAWRRGVGAGPSEGAPSR